jgi:hypothetical protein
MIGTYTLINNVGVNKFTVEKTGEAIKNGLCRKTTKWVQQDIVRRFPESYGDKHTLKEIVYIRAFHHIIVYIYIHVLPAFVL